MTDGEQRSTLAVVRSLGRAGHEVHVGSVRPKPLAGASRWAVGVVRLPPLDDEPGAYGEAVLEAVARLGIEVLVPMTDPSAGALLPLRDRIPETVVPFASTETYERVSDKGRLMTLARELGVPTPAEYVVARVEDAEAGLEWAAGRDLPLVLKPARSAVRTEAGVRTFGVSIGRSMEELRGLLHGYPPEAYPILVQDFVAGPGLGAFFLAHEGRVLARFAHRRLREKPPQGGVSVYRESVPLRADVEEYSVRLLEAVGWSGVAMVEFKERTTTGEPHLMEINGRFWGSLQLAVDAGVDFPRMLVAAALGESVEPAVTYRVGVRTRWLWGDVDHLLAVLLSNSSARRLEGFPSRGGTLLRVLRPWWPGERLEVLRPGDPRPFLRESLQWFGGLAG